MVDTDNILTVDKLTKHFKDFSLRDVSFQLPRGYVMGFIGPNGSGKSTTIKLILNLLRKDSGQINVFGLDNLQHELAIKDRTAFVFDENHYYEDLSIGIWPELWLPFTSTGNPRPLTST